MSVFLADLAEAEIASALCPAPAVDALIGYLLQHRRGDQAQVWHYRHAAAVEAVLPDHDVDEDERRSSLRDRFALLQAHSLKVSHAGRRESSSRRCCIVSELCLVSWPAY